MDILTSKHHRSDSEAHARAPTKAFRFLTTSTRYRVGLTFPFRMTIVSFG